MAKLSFKYQFILSFVLIEFVFILIIVGINLSFISNFSKYFIDNEIQTSSTMFSKLIKRPLMLYDLATLDIQTQTFLNMKDVVAVEIFDNINRLLSSQDNLEDFFKKIFEENIKDSMLRDRSFRLKTVHIKDDDIPVGSVKIIFENTQYIKNINKNKNITLGLILLEIFFSTSVAYIVGAHLTKKLNELTIVAKDIADNKNPNIAIDKYDSYEISTLINSLRTMNNKINKRKQNLEKLSNTDPLTKIFNRRYFDDIFKKEVNLARRDKKLFCLMYLDVDNFKLYNDTYGHQKGDDVLVSIANILKLNMKRPSDYAFRVGGEEFAAIFTAENEKNIYDFSEHVRASIEEKHIKHAKNKASAFVTASFGVVFVDFNENKNLKISKQELYKFADNLLYEAKSKGKNKILIRKNSY